MQNRLFSSIRESCARVADLAKSVRINRESLKTYAAELPVEIALAPVMDQESHFCDDPETMLVYFLVLDCINFGSGWFSMLELEPDCENGYFTISTRLKDDFCRRGSYSADFLQRIDAGECCSIFRQSPDNTQALELMHLFAVALNALGELLNRDFSGSCRCLIDTADGSAAALAEILLQMPFYRDVFKYEGQNVYILKRAQITASDLHIAFSGKSYGRFDDIGDLTIFADNLVPHVLKIDGMLTLSPELESAIAAGQPLESGCREEIELRACSIHAVELLREEFSSLGTAVSSQGLDYLLWNRGLAERYRAKPTHITRCFYY